MLKSMLEAIGIIMGLFVLVNIIMAVIIYIKVRGY